VAGEPTLNPYAPPASDPGDAGVARAAGAFARPLYSPRQIGVASFIGSPLTGVVLLQANYRAMARPGPANTTAVLGTLASVALFVVVFALPKGIPSLPFNLGAAYAMLGIANVTQGAPFAGHIAAGGARRSHWWVVLAVACMVAALFAALGGIFLALNIRPDP
jgi:hypothetical protein